MASSAVSVGELHIIMGPMFSGKTESVIRLLNRYQNAGQHVMAVNHVLDTRIESQTINSHAGKKWPALKMDDLKGLREILQYQEADVVAIDEAQFFVDLEVNVRAMVEEDHKIVLLCGLDGDYERRPFGELLQLIPFADSVSRLEAFCVTCKDGHTAGIFSKRIDGSRETVHVGGTGHYIPVCRRHYLL